MNLLKKILPLAILGSAAVMLILAIVDVFMGSVVLFDLLPVQLSAVLLLILSLGLTVLACTDSGLRRPLVLLACLLHTPIGGGMLVLYIYDLAFPDQIPMALILPFVIMLVAISSAMQAGVTMLCASLYAEEEGDLPPKPAEEDDLSADYIPAPRQHSSTLVAAVEDAPVAAPLPDALVHTGDSARILPATDLEPAVLRARAMMQIQEAEQQRAAHRHHGDPHNSVESAPEAVAEAAAEAAIPAAEEAQNEPTPMQPPVAEATAPLPVEASASAPAPRPAPVAVPTPAAPVEVTPEDEDDLMPIPKKKSRKQPAFETATKPAVPVVPKVAPPAPAPVPAPAPAPKAKEGKKNYTDPFGLLTEEVKPEHTTSAKSIFNDSDE